MTPPAATARARRRRTRCGGRRARSTGRYLAPWLAARDDEAVTAHLPRSGGMPSRPTCTATSSRPKRRAERGATRRSPATRGDRLFAPSRSGNRMVMDPSVFACRFPAQADQVARARREVVAYAREHGAIDPDGIALARLGGSDERRRARVRRCARAGRGRGVRPGAIPTTGLEIHVCDEGRGMMPRRDSPGPRRRPCAHDEARATLQSRDAPGRRNGGQHVLRRP